MASLVSFIKHLEMNNTYLSNFFKQLKRRNAFKLILQGQHHINTKTRLIEHKEGKEKRKSQANIPDEHKWENLQQNVSKLNSTIL